MDGIRAGGPPLAERPGGAPALDWLDGDVAYLRGEYERANTVVDRGERRWHSIRAADGRPLRLLIQAPRERRGGDCTLLYFHGGGWIVGSPSTHADISRSLCEETGLTLVSVDYRLAPEFVAPAPVEDGLQTLDYIIAELAGRVVLCGDSAGAAIALAVERAVDEETRGRIVGVCAFYGAFGLLDSRSLSRGDGMDRKCVRRYWTLANSEQVPSPYSIEALNGSSPVPVYLLGASEDPVLDDTLALSEVMTTAGREHVLDVVEETNHGFLHEVRAPSAISAVARVGEWIAARLRKAAIAST